MERQFTLGEVADHFGVQLWHIQKLYDKELVPDPHRLGDRRFVYASELPAFRALLQAEGRLSASGPVIGEETDG